MTVHFIGAGPGAPDLLTLRGRDIIASCPVCLYAGSLVPEAILAHCPLDAHVVNTAPMDLDQIMAEIQTAHEQGKDVARLHSGDLSVWSAMGEQMRRLRALGIPVSVTPGVPAFAAAAATLGSELTLPGLAQSVILTRTPGRASSMPEGETLTNFAATGATLAIHLSIQNLDRVVADLTPAYGSDCPVAIVYRASWPDEAILRGTLGTIAQHMSETIQRTALILVGPALAGEGFDESCLYAVDYDRRYRPQSAESPWSGLGARGASLMRGLLISAPSSGTGKTTVMLGLLRALTEDGLSVQPFKSGPDYIDPAFHRAAAGGVFQSRHVGDGRYASVGYLASGKRRGYLCR